MTDPLALLQRHREFWQRAPVAEPLVSRRRHSPLDRLELPLRPEARGCGRLHLEPDMLDVAEEAGRSVAGPEALVQGAAFNVRVPISRVPWVEAILGCPLWVEPDSGSIWSEPYLPDIREVDGLRLDPAGNAWYRKLLEFTRALVQANRGGYLVAQTLMRGPIDMVRAVLGDEAMCLAIYDHPAGLRRMLEVTTGTFIQIARGQLALIPPFHGGYCSPFGIWCPGTVVRTQCDMSALLSARQYAELVMPFDERISGAFDYSIIHLHSGYLHTVDPLLTVEKPLAIQVSIDDGPTSLRPDELAPLFARILERKPLLVEGHMTHQELESMLAQLPAAGLYVRADLDG